MTLLNKENSFLSISNTRLLRVVFEALVLVHHLYLAYTSFGATIIHILGPIAVGGFIFLSGYGVGFSFIEKGDEYAKKLLKLRVPKTYAKLFIVNLCYLILYIIIGRKFASPFSAIVSVLYLPVFDGFIPLSHWIYFLADLLIYYLLFLFFIFLFRKVNNRLLWTAITILVIDIIIIAVLSVINYQTGSARYLRACLCFPIGILCAIFSGTIAEIIHKHKILFTICSSAICVVITALLNHKPIIEYLLPIIAVFGFVSILCGVNTKSKLLDYLSDLVIYVYVSHEFFLTLCKHLLSINNISIHNNFIGLIVFACSMLFAILFDTFVKKSKTFIKTKRLVC